MRSKMQLNVPLTHATYYGLIRFKLAANKSSAIEIIEI